MYKYVATKISNDQVKYYFVNRDNKKISYSEFINALILKQENFLKIFIESLNDATSKLLAYFWECVPVSQDTIKKSFEFVVTKSEQLNNIKQNCKPFYKEIGKISASGKLAGSFLNLGRDAILVIPVAKKANGLLDYKNISNFTKNAPIEQQHEF